MIFLHFVFSEVTKALVLEHIKFPEVIWSIEIKNVPVNENHVYASNVRPSLHLTGLNLQFY